MDLKTSFNILDIDPEANEAQAKQAYKAQVRRWHPDQFPEGSATKIGAEEQLKQINIAYARVKAHLARHRPNPTVTATGTPTHPRQGTAVRHDTPGEKSKNRSWVDHLFDALNAFAGNRADEPPTTPSGQTDANRRKTFEQVLDEMAGSGISPKQNRQPGNPAAASRRTAAGYRHYRRSGGTVGAVSGTEGPGPVKPVGRVRGIGRNR
ncbi:MAG: J domain-containing protein [Desulfosarcina sp.]|nr:J domain-containing protein [Desulfosarcina sp.]MBC2741475.1 J domain-containing protein [Desulfosarcina sp.]MBC2764389.1 J domain-containing protein [Desulfosarcina sp.]